MAEQGLETLEHELVWSDLRTKIVDLFDGEVPRPETEEEIIAVWRSPAGARAVERTAESIAKRKNEGSPIRSCWAVLRKELLALSAGVEARIVAGEDRDPRIRQAEAWMHNAGKHFERVDEIEDELFGERGLLYPWRDDVPLQRSMYALYFRLRAEGELIEEALVERLAANRRLKDEMKAKLEAKFASMEEEAEEQLVAAGAAPPDPDDVEGTA